MVCRNDQWIVVNISYLDGLYFVLSLSFQVNTLERNKCIFELFGVYNVKCMSNILCTNISLQSIRKQKT